MLAALQGACCVFLDIHCLVWILTLAMKLSFWESPNAALSFA